MNAKIELLEAIEKHCPFHYVKCAKIEYAGDWDEPNKVVLLKVNHSVNDWNEFLKQLGSIEYSNGFGMQELYGIVWMTHNSWFERHEYDGSERWVYKTYPIIPAILYS